MGILIFVFVAGTQHQLIYSSMVPPSEIQRMRQLDAFKFELLACIPAPKYCLRSWREPSFSFLYTCFRLTLGKSIPTLGGASDKSCPVSII